MKTKTFSLDEFHVEHALPCVTEYTTLTRNFPPHTHAFDELVIIQSGSAKHVINGKAYPIGRGDVYVLHGGTVHAYKDVNRLSLVNVIFTLDTTLPFGEGLRALSGFQALFLYEPAYRYKGEPSPHFTLCKEEEEEVFAITERMEREYRMRDAGYHVALRGAFLTLLVTLSRMYEARQGYTLPSSFAKIAEAVAYLETRITENVSIEEVGDVAGLSVRHFSRLFKAHYGVSPLEYVLRKRMLRAEEMLLRTQARITDVAHALGFDDSNYFTKQFKRIEGVTPRAFREMKRAPRSAEE